MDIRTQQELQLTQDQRNSIGEDLSTPAQIPLDAISKEEADKKKRQQQQVVNDAQAAQQQQDRTKAKASDNALNEVGNAVLGAGVDAVESVGATAEKVVKGKLNDSTFTPTWLQVDDKQEPITKTWWGNVIRGIGEYAVLDLVTKGVASKIPGAKALAGEGIVSNIARGAVVGNISSQAEGPNASNLIHETFPWIPTPLAVQESDSPVMKRVKSTFEAAGFDWVFGKVGAAWEAHSAAKKAEAAVNNESLRQEVAKRGELGKAAMDRQRGIQQLKDNYERLKSQWVVDNNGVYVSPSKVQAEVNKLKAASKITPVDEARFVELQNRYNRSLEVDNAYKEYSKAKAEDRVTAKSETPDKVAVSVYEESVAKSAKAASKVEEDNAVHYYNKDPEFQNGPSPRTVHPDLADSHERAKMVPDTDIKTAVRNSILIDTDPRQSNGRIGSVMTDANYDKVTTGASDSVKKIVTEMMKKLEKDPQLETFIGGQRYSRQEVINMVGAKVLDNLEGLDNISPDDLRKSLLQDADVNHIGGSKWETMNSVSQAATQVLIRATAGDLADIATVERSVRGEIDTATQNDMFLQRLEVLLRLNKEASFVAGKKLADRKFNWVRTYLPDVSTLDEASKRIDDDVKSVISTVEQINNIHQDSRLLHAFMDAASISDGSVRTMTDMSKYVSKKVGVNGWLYASPGEQGYLLKGLISTFFNSVLSAPKTAVKALAGTTLLTTLRPVSLLTGGLLQRDPRIVAKSLHQMQAGFEGVNEALSMANMARMSWLKGEVNPAIVQGSDEMYLAYHRTQEFRNLEAYAEMKGTLGDKYAVRLAKTLSSFNSSPFVNYSMGIMDMGDTFTRTLIGRMELKSKAFDEAWIASNGKVDKNLVATYESKFRDSVFNKDGVVTDKAAIMASQEASLSTPLSGLAADADELIKSIPALRPFMMFPRTATNAMKYVITYTPMGHTPLLNKFAKEVDEIINCTPDDALGVMQKYGITDLEATRAMYEGRVALGNLAVFSAIGLYLNGRLSGNQDIGEDQKRLKGSMNGAPPARSIRMGDAWVSYDAFEPFSSILSLVADIGDKANPEDQEDMFSKVAFFVAANVTNKSFLSGLAQLADLVNGHQDRVMPTVAANTLNNLIPFGGFRNWTAQVFNPGMRELENDIGQRFKNRNPMLKGELPMKLDMLTGRPIRLNDPITRLISASTPVSINPSADPVHQQLLDSGYNYALQFDKGPDGEDLTPDEKHQMMIYATEGGKIGKELAALFKTKRYNEAYKNYRQYVNEGRSLKVIPIDKQSHIADMIDPIVRNAKREALNRYRQERGAASVLSPSQNAEMAKRAGRGSDFERQRQYMRQILPNQK
jgi:hypothetical protein